MHVKMTDTIVQVCCCLVVKMTVHCMSEVKFVTLEILFESFKSLNGAQWFSSMSVSYASCPEIDPCVRPFLSW